MIYMIAEVQYVQLFHSMQENITLLTDLGYFDSYTECENYANNYNHKNYEKWVRKTKQNYARIMENHYYPELITDEEKKRNYGININFLKEPDYSFNTYIHQFSVTHYRTVAIGAHDKMEDNYS